MKITRVYYICAAVVAGLSLGSPAIGQITVTVSPKSAVVRLATFSTFTAQVTGDSNRRVAWTVALPTGATGSPGSITVGGLYVPPTALPSGNTVIVTATTLAVPAVSDSATVSLENPYPTLSSTVPAFIPVGSATTLTMNGSNFVPGAQVIFGGVIYTAVTYVSPTQLKVTVTPTAAQTNTRVAVAVTSPAPGPATSTDVATVIVGTVDGPPIISASVAARFLEQAAFGPDAATIAHVQGTGLNGYLLEQAKVPVSPYPDPSVIGLSNQVQARFFSNAVNGQDQLRQRVALALSEIMVASGVEENTPQQLVPYLQVFQQDALGNFRTLMEDITKNVAMGEYLDMRNNDKANPITGTVANENYARELMQLFTIGLFQLNLDGSLVRDAGMHTIPTYDETTIQNFAKIYTGWTYPTKPGATPQIHNPVYYLGQMAPYEANHDQTSKTLLQYTPPPGVLTVLPANQTAELDLSEALDNIFYHPNVGPFISMQLIQHLVTSNPSPLYVARVAAVFNKNAKGVRGDLFSVAQAILLDTEARAGDTGDAQELPTSGHLREPMFAIPAMLRGLGAAVNDANYLGNFSANLGQAVFMEPTVFSYFAPNYQIPATYTGGATLLGPEFQLQTPSNAIARANLVYSMIYGNLGAGAAIDLTPYLNYGNNPPFLMAAINDAFFHGMAPSQFQADILSAVNAIAGEGPTAQKARAQVALYLALSSSYYQGDH